MKYNIMKIKSSINKSSNVILCPSVAGTKVFFFSSIQFYLCNIYYNTSCLSTLRRKVKTFSFTPWNWKPMSGRKQLKRGLKSPKCPVCLLKILWLPSGLVWNWPMSSPNHFSTWFRKVLVFDRNISKTETKEKNNTDSMKAWGVP